ncbi:hypothetical protein [Lysobacter tyrosinilyticus]
MRKFFITLLLIVALALPVALFLLLWPHFHLSALVAAAIAIAAGWALNVAWTFASQSDVSAETSPGSGNTLSIAARFGWACPTVLVLLAWAAWRIAA